MGYVEDYFHKEIGQIVDTDVVSFIAQNIQENLTLDYKDFRKYDDPVDLSRIIGSFANSVGGLIILGISEKENFPDLITWGDLSGKSRESLENKLLSQIYPKIHNLRIIPIYKSGSTTTGIYLIDVPQGENPPYMSGDHKYYRRLNFQKQPMEGYEVADFFGKRKRPRLSIVPHFSRTYDPSAGYHVTWNIKIKNVGKAFAKDPLCKIIIENAADVQTRNVHMSVVEVNENQYIIRGFFPVPDIPPVYPHPTMENDFGIINFLIPYSRDNMNLCQSKISYEILCDNMPIVTGKFTVSINDRTRVLSVIEFDETEMKDW